MRASSSVAGGPRPPSELVSSDLLDRLALAHDASHFLETPSGVARPRDVDEVVALLALAERHGTSVTFRSGGTSLSGQATTAALLADTRRHFRGVDVLDDGRLVRAQPGSTVRSVNTRLARYGRRLGPDPASEIAATVGGVVANNSSGMTCGVERNTYRTLESLVLVLADGTVLDTGPPDADRTLLQLRPDVHEGLARLRDDLRADHVSAGEIRRLFAMKNTMGYAVNAFLDHDSPVKILEHLVVGSEGTLAFVAEATFRTVPAAPHAATALLMLPDLAAAAAVVPALIDAAFDVVELMDSTSLDIARRSDAARWLTSGDLAGRVALLVELQATTGGELAARRAEAEVVLSRLTGTQAPQLTDDPQVRESLWHLRKGLYATVAANRRPGTTTILEDIAVPLDRLMPTCRALGDLLRASGYEDGAVFGHVRDGNLHFSVCEDFGTAEGVARFDAFAEAVVELVLGEGGVLKAEHGTGRMMAPYLERQYGDSLYDVMVRVKDLLDPSRVLNPTSLIVGDAGVHLRSLKTMPSVDPTVDRCVECGYCETACPSRDLTLTPRTRITLQRDLRRGSVSVGDDATSLQARSAYAAVDTCAADGMCQTVCPVGIDTGDLVRAARARTAGRMSRAGWRMFARHWNLVTSAASVALTVAAAVPWVATACTRLLRRVLGDRRVPLWHSGMPAGGQRRTPQPHVRPDAVLFPSCLGTVFGPVADGPGAGDATANLCAKAGIATAVPGGIAGLCCGSPWKSKGHLEGYDVMRRLVVDALMPVTDHGRLPVVVDSSSCAESLAALLTGHGIRVVEATSFVADVALDRLRIDRSIDSLVLHPTCSSVRTGTDSALRAVAAAVAHRVETPAGWGCCGMAGDRGLLHPELTASATSREASEVMALDAERHASTNRPCEIAMSRATGTSYTHILALLDDATW